MKLEEEIRISYFKNRNQKAIVNLQYTNNWVVRQINQLMKQSQLTYQQYMVLKILDRSDPQPLSISNIRSSMLDRMSDVSRIVERLRVKALLDRTVRASDRREVDISLTEVGKRQLDQIDSSSHLMENILSRLTIKELDQLNVLLEKVRS